MELPPNISIDKMYTIDGMKMEGRGLINLAIKAEKFDDFHREDCSVQQVLKSEHKAYGCAYCEYRSRYRGDVYKHQSRRHQDKPRSLLRYCDSGQPMPVAVKQPTKLFIPYILPPNYTGHDWMTNYRHHSTMDMNQLQCNMSRYLGVEPSQVVHRPNEKYHHPSTFSKSQCHFAHIGKKDQQSSESKNQQVVQSSKPPGTTSGTVFKKLKCLHCFYRSNWKGDLVRHVTREHNGSPASDIIVLPIDQAMRTFPEYECTFGRLLRSRLLIGLIEYRNVDWQSTLRALAANISRTVNQAIANGSAMMPKFNQRLSRISAEYVRLSGGHQLIDLNIPFVNSGWPKRHALKAQTEGGSQSQGNSSGVLDDLFHRAVVKQAMVSRQCVLRNMADSRQTPKQLMLQRSAAVHIRPLVRLISYPVSSDPKPYGCSLCSGIWTYDSMWKASRHKDLHTSTSGYECMACHFSTYFKNVITIHNARKHFNCGSIRRVKTIGMPMLVRSRNKQRKHIIPFSVVQKAATCVPMRSYDQNYVCNTCHTLSRTWIAALQHNQQHRPHKGAVYICQQCHLYFKTLEEVRAHKRNYHCVSNMNINDL